MFFFESLVGMSEFWSFCDMEERTQGFQHTIKTLTENYWSFSPKRLGGMTVLTLHIPWHVPLFPIRSRESQGFSLDFGQHVSAAGLSWRLRTARRDTWTREPHAPKHTSARAKCLYSAICSTFCLSSNYRTILWIRSLIHTSQTRSSRPGCIAGRCICVCMRARGCVCSDST